MAPKQYLPCPHLACLGVGGAVTRCGVSELHAGEYPHLYPEYPAQHLHGLRAEKRELNLTTQKKLFIPSKTNFRKLWFRMLQEVQKGYSFILLQFTVEFIYFPILGAQPSTEAFISFKYQVYFSRSLTLTCLCSEGVLQEMLFQRILSIVQNLLILTRQPTNKQCNILQQCIRNRTSVQYFRYICILYYQVSMTSKISTYTPCYTLQLNLQYPPISKVLKHVHRFTLIQQKT